MKKLLVATCFTLLVIACKEKQTLIVLHAPETLSVDTTYMLAPANIPAPNPHNVLIEEYTGQSCSNCPGAHEILKKTQDEHPGRINVIGLYVTGPNKTIPPPGYKYDFRNAKATTIANTIYGGVSSLPLAGIDRTPASGSIKQDKSLWSGSINTGLGLPDSINMKVVSSYNTVDSMATIIDSIIYTKTVGYAHNLSIVIVEDSLIDIQEYPSTDTVHPIKDDAYVFTNVFRDMVTSAPVGDPLLPAITVKEAGRVIVRVFKYKVSKDFNPAHCRVISFINSGVAGDTRVLQSAVTKMK